MDKQILVTTKVYEIPRVPLSIRRAAGITVWAEPVSSLTSATSGKIMLSKLVVSTSIAASTAWTVNANNNTSFIIISYYLTLAIIIKFNVEEVRIPMFCLSSVISVTLPVSTASLLSANDTY